MSRSDIIRAYRDGYEPCARHPSRRARGWCERCGRAWCRDCIFPVHRCRPRQAPRPAGPGPAIVFLVLLAAVILAALWALLPSGSRPRPVATSQPVSARSPRLAQEPPPVLHGGRPQGPPAPRATAAPVAAPGRQPVPAASMDRGPVGRDEMLLSFDAGSRTDGASEILDVLAAHGIRTTVFVTGQFVRSHPALARRLLRDGHEVGNHTDSHLHLTLWEEAGRHTTRPDLTRERLLAELAATDAAFREVTGQPLAPLWRAPYGEVNPEILAWAAAAGWRHVGWTRRLDTLDWVADPGSELYREPGEIASRLLDFPSRDRHRARGGIVLMHLGSERPDEARLHRALPAIVQGLRRLGLQFTTASDMVSGL